MAKVSFNRSAILAEAWANFRAAVKRGSPQASIADEMRRAWANARSHRYYAERGWWERSCPLLVFSDEETVTQIYAIAAE